MLRRHSGCWRRGALVTGQTLLWDYRPAELGSEARVCGGWVGRVWWLDGGMWDVSEVVVLVMPVLLGAVH